MLPTPLRRTTTPQRLAHALAAMLLSTGSLHFLAPKQFDAIIPPEIPLPRRGLTYASGVAEIAIGVGLLVPATRRRAAAGAVALLVAVYPANISMVRLWWKKPLAYRVAAIARLPLQIPLIAAAVAVYRATPPARPFRHDAEFVVSAAESGRRLSS